MIQRIQSIWLLLAAIAAFATMKFSFFSGNLLVDNVKVYKALTALESGLLVLILTIAIGVASLVAIFLFKDRKRQLLVTAAILVVNLFTIGLYFGKSIHFLPNEGSLDLTSIVGFSVPVFLLLAMRSIWKDEQLVKSTDRLR
jgi:uncharacterized membrane protein